MIRALSISPADGRNSTYRLRYWNDNLVGEYLPEE